VIAHPDIRAFKIFLGLNGSRSIACPSILNPILLFEPTFSSVSANSAIALPSLLGYKKPST
jgi:hypothetical protein